MFAVSFTKIPFKYNLCVGIFPKTTVTKFQLPSANLKVLLLSIVSIVILPPYCYIHRELVDKKTLN